MKKITFKAQQVVRVFHHHPAACLKQEWTTLKGTYQDQEIMLNPLTHFRFEGLATFIDGRDINQINWYRDGINRQQFKKQDVLMVMGQMPYGLYDFARDYAIYFDEQGEMASRYAIERFPAILRQEAEENDFLTIFELAI